ncbi:transposase [Frankia sp. AiPa1]|uniref:tetratricopeptide repeat protein n=1 Tax=Frankia sp. AiPa1 TaxID=573492 RepID=UPI00202B60F7|nr:transposase [Frankia sp. AiPa1]MCL9760157.1 transposase [Frankia sp. AiPa1]
MREFGMSHDEIAGEFGRRFRFRPRAAFRHAFGWTLQEAADAINAQAASLGLDPDGRASMTGPRLSELESWPASGARRPTPQILALLAHVYGTGIHHLLDLEDREHLAPADLLLLDSCVREVSAARGRPPAMSAGAVRGRDTPRWPGAAGGLPQPALLPVVVDNEPISRPPALRSRTPVPVGVEGEGSPTKRREVLAAAGASAVAALLAQSAVESAMFGQRWEESDLGSTTLEHLDLEVQRFGLSYLHTPPEQLFMQVRECRQRVSAMVAGRQTLSQRQRLCVVGGWLSGLMGHLALDLGDSAVAHAHCLTAWQLAMESGDARLGGWVRGTQAMIAFYTGDAADALRYALAGLDVAPRNSFLQTRLLAQQGRAHARLGDADGVSVAFARAEDSFESVTEKASHSIFSFDYPYLPFYAGTAYTALSRPEKARTFAQQAVTLCDAAAANWPVARALARVDLALAAVRQKEPDRACAVTVEALEICATERPVDLIVRRTGEVVRELRPYQELSAVRDLYERQTNLSRTVRGMQRTPSNPGAGSAAHDRQADIL